ncbi:MAG: lipid A export permease/ATP-binding protein MsbA [Cellvibrionaceae bacterium]
MSANINSASQDNSPKASDSKIYLRLLSYVKPLWWVFLLSIVGFWIFSIIEVGLIAVTELLIGLVGGELPAEKGFLSKWVVAEFGEPNMEVARWAIPAIMLFMMLVRGFGLFMGTYCLTYVSRKVIHGLRSQLFNHIVELPCSYYDSQSSGHIISKISYNVEQVTGAITEALKVVLRESIKIVALLVYMFSVDWRLTLMFFALIPLIGLVVNRIGKRFRILSRNIQTSMGNITHVTSEAINGHHDMRIYGAVDYEQKRFSKASENNRRQSMKLMVANTLGSIIIQMLIGSVMALIIWICLDPLFLENMTAGLFIAYIGAAGSLAKPARQLSEVYSTIQKGLAASESIFEILDSPKEQSVEQSKTPLDKEAVKGTVEFRNVSFWYESPEQKALNSVSFTANPGETIALVGSSGSGKSTLVSLLAGFYRAQEGGVYIDNHNLEETSLQELRQQISYVSQKVTLFNDTVFNNIAYGELSNSSKEDVERAVKLAYADMFIEQLPGGFETELGDDAMRLSGGQRQRLAIARAILKNAPILVLDEATSALDNESERYIQAAMEEVMKGRTTFVIAHRLSTIEGADRILVLENGRIVEEGNHDSLIAKSGRYALLHSQQFADI